MLGLTLAYSGLCSGVRHSLTLVLGAINSKGAGCLLLQAIKDVLWAFATLNYEPSAEFLAAAAEHCRRRLPEFNPQNIANVAWAYAKLGQVPGGNLLQVFADEVSHPSLVSQLFSLPPCSYFICSWQGSTVSCFSSAYSLYSSKGL